MALLASARLILSKPLINLIRVRIKFRPLDRRHPPIAGRFRICQHLRHTIPADAKIPDNLPTAQSILEVSPPHLQIQIHGVNPQTLPNTERAKVDDFDATRDTKTTTLSWPSIAPPITPSAFSPDQQGSGLNECLLTYLCWDKPTIASRSQGGCTGPARPPGRAVAPTARARGFTADSDPLKCSGNNAVSMRFPGHSRPASAGIGQISVARPFRGRVTTARTAPAQSPVPQGFDALHSPWFAFAIVSVVPQPGRCRSCPAEGTSTRRRGRYRQSPRP